MYRTKHLLLTIIYNSYKAKYDVGKTRTSETLEAYEVLNMKKEY